MLSYSYAGFWVRAAAFVIDGILVCLGQAVIRFTLFISFGVFMGENPLDYTFLFQYTWKDAIIYLAGVAYFVMCTYFTGTTLGKKALNLRVVSAGDDKPSFLDILFRETIGRFLSAFLLGAGYIMAGLTREKAALHDMICDTRVIYAKAIPTYLNGDINKRYTYQEAGSAPQESPMTAVPGRIVETPDRTISIYERYRHIDPNETQKDKETEVKETKPEHGPASRE